MKNIKNRILAAAFIMLASVTAVAHETELQKEEKQPETVKPKKSFQKHKVYAGWTVGGWTGADFKDGVISSENMEGVINNKTISSFHIGEVNDFYFSKNLYAGCAFEYNRTGYKQKMNITSGKYWNDEAANYEGNTTTTVTLNKLSIPVHFGAYYNITPKLKLFAEAGPYVSYTIAGRSKTEGYLITHEDIHSGEKQEISEKDHVGKGYLDTYRRFGFGASAAAGISFHGFLFQFTYQRGLSKTMRDSKQYEQNFMFSLGYEINVK